jgi:hypothetical protein
MSGNKKADMFAKLVAQQAKPVQEEPMAASQPAAEDTAPPPALPPSAPPKAATGKTKVETPKGKRDNPDYCQANAYVPKSLRKAVDRALLDIDGMDYSTLVTDLLRKWVKSRGVSE